MPRVTKAMLEDENKVLKERFYELQNELVYLRKRAKDADTLLKNPMSAMTVALERVTDALAHTVAKLEDKRR